MVGFFKTMTRYSCLREYLLTSFWTYSWNLPSNTKYPIYKSNLKDSNESIGIRIDFNGIEFTWFLKIDFFQLLNHHNIHLAVGFFFTMTRYICLRECLFTSFCTHSCKFNFKYKIYCLQNAILKTQMKILESEFISMVLSSH